jgi:glyoxylase-like metal-dependent hydrolase (beta-lactamase superfamily II)
MPKLEIRVGQDDLHRLPDSVVRSANFKVLKNHEVFRVGSIAIAAMATPGHSAGAYSYLIDRQAGVDRPYLLTGDTLFIRDCGRTDLETGSNEQMYASIQKMKQLAHETVFLVGHHYAKECATTLQRELKDSPPLRARSVADLALLP